MSNNASTEIPAGISIVLCGQAGQGIQTVENLLTRILWQSGYNVFATKEYMSRVRGGMNSTEIRIGSEPVRAMVEQINILIPLNRGAIGHVSSRISPQTVILAEKNILGEDFKEQDPSYIDIPFTDIATKIGSKIYSNIVAVGAVCALFSIDLSVIKGYVQKYFSAKAGDIIEKNLAAVQAGYELGLGLVKNGKINIKVNKNTNVKDQMLLNGSEAIALGAIAGGCNFISAYPMTPGTGVLVFLAQHGRVFGVIAEQAEDEIAAINMALGAWYAGGRAMVTTSGGGFALMTEGLSLAGMLELPVVIHLSQRPAPATGLPTRTEQADLELALYAGHGEFPRVILAPGNIEEAYDFARRAFNLADKYQVPVFILTDQYLTDTYYSTAGVDLSDAKIEKHIITTTQDYKRYQLTENGISPRGIPSLGEGLVCLDSDEHDIAGHITEDLDLRVKMVDKRLKKMALLKEAAILPELSGPEDYKYLVVSWGSTCEIINEAISILGRNDVASLHFSQVYPLHPRTGDYLQKATKTIVVENNATGQFARLIKIHTGMEINQKILKYNGLSFSVEEVIARLKAILD